MKIFHRKTLLHIFLSVARQYFLSIVPGRINSRSFGLFTCKQDKFQSNMIYVTVIT